MCQCENAPVYAGTDKVVYLNSLTVLDAAMETAEKLSDIGLQWDFGSGVFGENMDRMVNALESNLLRAMNLHLYETDGPPVMGLPNTVAIYKRLDGDMQYSVYCDEFSNILFYTKEDKEEVRNHFWEAIVCKSEASKTWLAEKGIKVGVDLEENKE